VGGQGNERTKAVNISNATFSRNGAANNRNGGVTTEKMLVTPQMAQEWLSRNVGNRNINTSRVDLFARLIREGKFHLTHQGVAFYADGDLADGQTRLSAIIKAGISVLMFVTRGLPRSAIHAIDGGRPRSVHDVIHFLGVGLSKNHVAVCRVLWAQYDLQRRENASSWNCNTVDTHSFAQFAIAAADAIEFAMPAWKKKGLTHACYVASVASAWFTQDRECLERFKQLISDGVGAERHETAAITLRDFLLTSPLLNGGNRARQEIFIRSCTALRAFLDRRPLSKLYARTEAVFDIPKIV
jgi:hypothetical protein